MIEIYRKRYMPDELLRLKDDKILLVDDEKVITKWKSLKPRPDFSHGLSCYFLHKNYKISKFFDRDGNLVYHYCDIVRAEITQKKYVFNDLLVDILVYPNGDIKILDLDELAAAYDTRLISGADLFCALTTLDGLLKIIYAGDFEKVVKVLDGVAML